MDDISAVLKGKYIFLIIKLILLSKILKKIN